MQEAIVTYATERQQKEAEGLAYARQLEKVSSMCGPNALHTRCHARLFIIPLVPLADSDAVSGWPYSLLSAC